MFLEWMTFLGEDIRQAIMALEPKDMAYPSYTILWLVILFYPLHGIDRQDPVAGLVYILYCLGSGATLVFALPEHFTNLSDMPMHIGVLMIMGLGAAYRWFHKNNQTLTREEHENLLKKEEEEKNAA